MSHERRSQGFDFKSGRRKVRSPAKLPRAITASSIAVVLTDERGKPTGDAKHYLGPGVDARAIACMLVRRRRRTSVTVRGFNEKLQYPRMKF